MVQIKAAAAEAYLGKRGVGYCLVDRDGASCDDIRAVAIGEPLKSVVRDKLRTKKTFRYKDLRAFLGHWPNDEDLDQIQSLALAYDLDYRANLYPAEEAKTGFRLDFSLQLQPQFPS